MSSKLAEHLQKLGYPGGEELGYQTFLYGTERDLRNVFLFLIDKLPKDEEAEAEAETGLTTFLEVQSLLRSIFKNSDLSTYSYQVTE